MGKAPTRIWRSHNLYCDSATASQQSDRYLCGYISVNQKGDVIQNFPLHSKTSPTLVKRCSPVTNSSTWGSLILPIDHFALLNY